MKRYLIIREDNIPLFTSKILNQMSAYYRAQVILMRKDPSKCHVGVELNANLIIFPWAQLTIKQARMKSVNSSAIFLSGTDNYLEHVPTVDRSTRAMVGLGHGAYALVVEILDNKKFQIRNLTVAKNYCVDLGKKFDGKTITKLAPLSCTFGDLHEFTHDKEILSKFIAHAKKLGTPEINLGDCFDGISLNHHEIHSSFFIVNKIANGVSLEAEVKSLAATLNKLSKTFKVNVIESNHDDFINKILRDNESLEKLAELDKILMLELKVKIMRNILARKKSEPTLKTLLEQHCKLSKNITFLKNDDVVSRAGFIVSLHGDKGPNGAKFNYKSTTLPMSVTGHNHVGGYRNNNFSVGHCTDLSKQHYAKGGLSSWTYSLVDIYANGTAQLITFFK